MDIFNKLFGKHNSKDAPAKHKAEQKEITFEEKHANASKLFASALRMYNERSCPCAFPRFQQIIGIDCRKSGYSFMCFDTELLIGLSKEYFEITDSELADENQNERWTCKKCGSVYEFGWQDFSIAVDRQKLKLIDLKTNVQGKEIEKPIPLYIGLMGHSYPPKTEITGVSFEYFRKYILEE